MRHIDRILNCVTAKKKTAGADQEKSVIENLLELRNRLENELEALAAKHVYELASKIRHETNSSFDDAYSASLAAIEYISANVLRIPQGLERMAKVNPSQIPLQVRRQSQDSRKLDKLVEVVMETASDRETHVGEETWIELLDVVTHADPVLCVDVLKRFDCSAILRMIERLQAETVWRKRRLILNILFHCLKLSAVFLGMAVNSILPAELARDIQAEYAGHGTNKERVNWSCKVLTLSLCSKERISFAQQSQLGCEFVLLLLDILESESVSVATIEATRSRPTWPARPSTRFWPFISSFKCAPGMTMPFSRCWPEMMSNAPI